jgi:uncharacterized membrane-anchored protein
MTPTVARIVIVLAALLVLGAVNSSIASKERVIRDGEVVYLELAPVDPRSLMQGDYMALSFRLAAEIEDARARASIDERARSAPLTLDGRRVATLDAAGQSALRIGFRIRSGRVWLGTNAYFFSEGSAARYAGARYGEFRLDRDSGDAVLVGLRDENLTDL